MFGCHGCPRPGTMSDHTDSQSPREPECIYMYDIFLSGWSDRLIAGGVSVLSNQFTVACQTYRLCGRGIAGEGV